MESLRVRARLAGCVETVIFVLAAVFAMGKAADCLGLWWNVSVYLLQWGCTCSLTLDDRVNKSLYNFINALLSCGFFWGLIYSCCFPLLFNALINIGYHYKRSNTQMSCAGEGLGYCSAFTSKTFLLPVSLSQIIESYQKDVYNPLFHYCWQIPLPLERNIFKKKNNPTKKKPMQVLLIVI